MPVIPANIGRAVWPGRGSFRPCGKLLASCQELTEGMGEVGAVNWSRRTLKSPVLSARLFVGFNVAGKPKWSIDDVIPIVKKLRLKQAPEDPSASFLIQKGLYRHKSGTRFVEEDSAQVIIIDTVGITRAKLRVQMIELGEALARKLKQEEVIVELQANGVVFAAMGVGP